MTTATDDTTVVTRPHEAALAAAPASLNLPTILDEMCRTVADLSAAGSTTLGETDRVLALLQPEGLVLFRRTAF